MLEIENVFLVLLHSYAVSSVTYKIVITLFWKWFDNCKCNIFLALDCDDCKELRVGECPIHGPFTWIKDNVCTKGKNTKAYIKDNRSIDSRHAEDATDSFKTMGKLQ